jgi:hypothetical protein
MVSIPKPLTLCKSVLHRESTVIALTAMVEGND